MADLAGDGRARLWQDAAGRRMGAQRGGRFSRRADRAGGRLAGRNAVGDGRGGKRTAGLWSLASPSPVRTFAAAAGVAQRGAGNALFGGGTRKPARAATQPCLLEQPPAGHAPWRESSGAGHHHDARGALADAIARPG
ncbi:hypothetical protein E4T56_gene17526 [Termitomyces sp. T112]|nr:hypothetical protein E4T56_gene17526 [Termitomyces sp. T112]